MNNPPNPPLPSTSTPTPLSASTGGCLLTCIAWRAHYLTWTLALIDTRRPFPRQQPLPRSERNIAEPKYSHLPYTRSSELFTTLELCAHSSLQVRCGLGLKRVVEAVSSRCVPNGRRYVVKNAAVYLEPRPVWSSHVLCVNSAPGVSSGIYIYWLAVKLSTSAWPAGKLSFG